VARATPPILGGIRPIILAGHFPQARNKYIGTVITRNNPTSTLNRRLSHRYSMNRDEPIVRHPEASR
jgi:hypothetical protein